MISQTEVAAMTQYKFSPTSSQQVSRRCGASPHASCPDQALQCKATILPYFPMNVCVQSAATAMRSCSSCSVCAVCVESAAPNDPCHLGLDGALRRHSPGGASRGYFRFVWLLRLETPDQQVGHMGKPKVCLSIPG